MNDHYRSAIIGWYAESLIRAVDYKWASKRRAWSFHA
jgi:hypothetical protein